MVAATETKHGYVGKYHRCSRLTETEALFPNKAFCGRQTLSWGVHYWFNGGVVTNLKSRICVIRGALIA